MIKKIPYIGIALVIAYVLMKIYVAHTSSPDDDGLPDEAVTAAQLLLSEDDGVNFSIG